MRHPATYLFGVVEVAVWAAVHNEGAPGEVAGCALVCFFGQWSTEGLGEIPADADDGDACGRRHLLGGVVEALFIFPPSRAPWETLDPLGWIRQRQLHAVVSSL